MKAETNIIRFYEGSYQYNVVEVQTPRTDTELFTGVLKALREQMQYRSTVEELWAEVLVGDQSEKLYIISYLEGWKVQVRDLVKGGEFKFAPLEDYSFILLASY
jgi:hypothetical protein